MSLRHVILFIAVLFFYKCSNAQFILAGQYNIGDYYELKNAVNEVYYGDSASYPIDVNGDGVIDCIIKINLSFGFRISNICENQLNLRHQRSILFR